MNFKPVTFPQGYGMRPNVTTWGGGAIFDGSKYHIYVSRMTNDCLLKTWCVKEGRGAGGGGVVFCVALNCFVWFLFLFSVCVCVRVCAFTLVCMRPRSTALAFHTSALAETLSPAH
jgi:hypothetical protein